MPRKRMGYDAACYYDGKLLGRCTKADSDAYTLLMNACCRTGKGRTASEGKAQPWCRALTSGHAGPKQKGGGNHATQTDGL